MPATKTTPWDPCIRAPPEENTDVDDEADTDEVSEAASAAAAAAAPPEAAEFVCRPAT